MTRERLEQLSKYELAEIILRQQEMLELQQTRIEQLEAPTCPRFLDQSE